MFLGMMPVLAFFHTFSGKAGAPLGASAKNHHGRGNPEGCQKVAGGRGLAATPG